MKKLLFITSNTPSDGNAGDKTTKILLNELGDSYLVDLIYFKYKRAKEYEPDSPNVRVFKIVHNSKIKKIANVILFPIIYPMFSVRFNWLLLFKLRRIIKEGDYSGVVLVYSQTFLYGRFFNHDIPIFLYSMDILAQKISRLHGGLTAYICKKSEQFCLSIPNSYIYTVSKKDCELVNSLYNLPSNEALAYIDPQIVESIPTFINNDTYVFMAAWSREENREGLLWFFESVAPLIDFYVRIVIVGRGLPSDFIRCNNDRIKIEVLGFVDNPYPIVSNCRAFLSPLFNGAGVKQKVFEALACGTPVIGNEIAFEGIDNRYGDYMLHFENEREFIECMKKEIPIEERVSLKNNFSRDYHSKTIPQYIKEIIG